VLTKKLLGAAIAGATNSKAQSKTTFLINFILHFFCAIF
jgi:hypothetical protein